MKFFMPQVAEPQVETVYQSLVEAAKSQMKITITPRRIYGLNYVHDKRTLRLVVGGAHPEHLGHIILAILESNPYMVVTHSLRGGGGLTILVNGSEVTETVEFDEPTS